MESEQVKTLNSWLHVYLNKWDKDFVIWLLEEYFLLHKRRYHGISRLLNTNKSMHTMCCRKARMNVSFCANDTRGMLKFAVSRCSTRSTDQESGSQRDNNNSHLLRSPQAKVENGSFNGTLLISLWGQYYAYFQFKEETRLIEIKKYAQSYGVGRCAWSQSSQPPAR